MDISYALVIEDDCVLIENFITRFKERSRGFPPDWDIYFPNSCPNPGFRTKGGFTQIKGPHTKEINIKDPPSSVFTISYFITKNAAIKLVEEIEKNKLWLAIDHEHNWLFYTLNLKVIWNSAYGQRLTLWNTSGFKSSMA